MSLKKLQDKTVDNFAAQNPGQAFDPAIIVMLADFVVIFLEIFQDCRAGNPLDVANSPTWLQRRYAHRVVRRELGRREYRKHGAGIVKALLDTGRDLTKEDLEEAYQDLD